jgi:hypothetical protein
MFAGLGVAALLLIAASTAGGCSGERPRRRVLNVSGWRFCRSRTSRAIREEFLGDGLTEELIAGLGRFAISA